jgi:hypothetical protein
MWFFIAIEIAFWAALAAAAVLFAWDVFTSRF